MDQIISIKYTKPSKEDKTRKCEHRSISRDYAKSEGFESILPII